MNRQTKKKATAPANQPTTVFDAVQYHVNHDGWDTFTRDLGTNIIFEGLGDYYVHNEGSDFVNRIHKLKRMSAQHAAVVTQKVLYVCGQGLNLGDKPGKDLIAFYDNAPEVDAAKAKADIAAKLGVNYSPNIRAAAMRSVNLNKLTKLIAKDLMDFGGSYLMVYITGGKITKQIHLPYHSVLVAKRKEGDLDGLRYFYVSDKGTVSKDTPRLHQFDPNQLEDQFQIIDLRLPHCEDTIYSYPDWIAAIDWILLDGYIAQFFTSFAKKNFWLGGYIKTSQTPPAEVREKTKRELKAHFAGTGNAGEYAILWGADENTEIGSFPINSSDDLFSNQQLWIAANIRSGHKVTSTALMGLPPESSGGVTFQAKDQLTTALQVFQNTIIAPFQFVITDHFNEILRFNGVADTLTITEYNPFYQSNDTKNATNQTLNEGEANPVTAPVASLDGAATSTDGTATATVQDTAMNGAQVASLIDIVAKVGQGIITKATAEPLIRAAFPALNEQLISAMIDGVQPITPTSTPSI